MTKQISFWISGASPQVHQALRQPNYSMFEFGSIPCFRPQMRGSALQHLGLDLYSWSLSFVADEEGVILLVASMVVIWFQKTIFNTWELKVQSVGYRLSDVDFFIQKRRNIALVWVVLYYIMYVQLWWIGQHIIILIASINECIWCIVGMLKLLLDCIAR